MSFETEQTEAAGFPSAAQTRWILSALFLYFAARLVYLALSIGPAVPPDETTHFAVSRIFSQVLLLPVDSPETYQHGLVTHIPWLYYWLMGKLLLLNFLGLNDLVFLRLLNIPLALGTVWFGLRTLRLLTGDRLPQILLVLFLTNTMMFTFLSASVSYDNLANLLAAMAIYYLFAFFRERSADLLALSLLCQLAGCLTKYTLLPLVLLLHLVLLVNECRRLGALPAAFASWLRGSGPKAAALLAGLALALALNVQLYGGNYLKYHSLAPEMAQVLSADSAMQYRTQARNMIFTQFKEGRLSKEQALKLTGSISHEADRGSTVALIEEYDYLKSNRVPLFTPLEYIPVWLETMCMGIFGIFAHQVMPAGTLKIALFLLLLLLSGIGFVKEWRPREEGWLAGYLALIAGCYGVFLMYFVNYRTYLEYWATWLSLQGRYIFPVLVPICVLSSLYLLRLASARQARLALFAGSALLFLFADFPYFLARVNAGWFAWPPG